MGELPSGTVTFLFTDIEGSTRLLEALGDRYRGLQDAHHRILRDAIEDHDGVVINTMGDGVFAAFADATSAVDASVQAQRDLQAFAWPHDGVIRVRMGLHSGEATADNGEYVSLVVHHAARVGNAGHGGQIVLSETAHALCRPDGRPYSFRDLGSHRLKDLSGPVRLHQVCHPELDQRFPPLRSLDQVAHNLPVQLTSFVGRERELREITKLVGDHRLVTLTGAGGSGKTRLALHVAAAVADGFDGGTWFVELAPLVDPNAVVLAVADALHLRAQPGRTPRELVTERLSGTATLLVVDNCEHVIEAAAELIAAIVATCPNATVVATSRETLGVPGEIVWRVPSMETSDETSDGIRLFLERARLSQPDWVPTTDDERAAIVEICERLDGIPLAIELAAARLDLLAVDQIRTRLHDRFRLLTGGSRVALERQRTLRATVDWSYALLDEEAQTLLRRLSVFAGGFTLEAAEAACSDDVLPAEHVLDVLTDLSRKSLVVDDHDKSRRRYRLLETIRQYAREPLLAAGEANDIETRRYGWLVHLLRNARAQHFVGIDWFAEADAIDVELDNIVAALTWAADDSDPTRLDELVLRCQSRWRSVGHLNLVHHWLRVALDHPGTRPEHVRGRLLLAEAVVLDALGDLSGARCSLEQSTPLLTADPDPYFALWRLQTEAIAAEKGGDFDTAQRLHDEAIALARRAGHHLLLAAELNNRAATRLSVGDLDGAVETFEEARALARAANAPRHEAQAAANLALVLHHRGDIAAAASLLAETGDTMVRTGDRVVITATLGLRFELAAGRDGRAALAIAEQIVAHARRTGSVTDEVAALDCVGRMAFAGDDLATASHAFAEAGRKARSFMPEAYAAGSFDSRALLSAGDTTGALAVVERSYKSDARSETGVALYVHAARRDAVRVRLWLGRVEEQDAYADRSGSSAPLPRALLAVLEGDAAAARPLLRATLEHYSQRDSYSGALDVLDLSAALSVTEGDAEAAGTCLGLATTAGNALHFRKSQLGVDLWRDATSTAAKLIDEEAFATGWKRGEAAGVDGLFALATELVASK
ncbi:MAG: hypothetical protein QOG90_2211 [Actinomycetota bacterium]